MTLAIELRPPTEPGEIENITFDYGPQLATTEVITSITWIKCAVISGNDSPSGHIQGSGTIIASPNTGLPNAAVLVQAKAMLGANTYQYQCMVLTSASQQLLLRVNLPCVIIPTGT